VWGLFENKTGKQKAIDLLLTGKPFTSQQANRVIGWKFATRLSEAIRELSEKGFQVEKHTYKKRFRTYQLKVK